MAENILKKYKDEQTNSLKEYLKSQINLIKGLGKTELADKNIPKEDKAIFKDVISQITSTMNVGSKPKREAYITAGKELTEIQKSLTSLAEDPDLKFNKGFMAALNAPTKNSATGIALNFIKEKQPSLPGAAASGAVDKMKEVSGGFLKTMAMDIVGGLPFGGAIVDWASTKVEGAVEGIGKGKKLTETELGVGRAFSPGGVDEDDEEENGADGEVVTPAPIAGVAGVAEGNGGTSEVIKDVKEEIMGGESTGGGGGGLEFTNELLINIDDNLQWIRDNSDSAETKREMRRDKGLKKAGGELVNKEGMEGMDDDGGPGFWSNFLGSMIGTGGLGGILGIKKMIGTGIFGGKGGLFRNLKAALLRTARTAFGKGGGQMLSKIFTGLGIVAKLGAIAGVLIAPIIDGITGYFNAEKWDVSKLSGIIGGILGGGEGGGINAIFNSMKWAAAGAAAGTLIMPGVGTIIGGIGGAILGAILGFFGGDKIAKLMDEIGAWFGKQWTKLKVALGFEKETKESMAEDISEERKTLETQLADIRAAQEKTKESKTDYKTPLAAKGKGFTSKEAQQKELKRQQKVEQEYVQQLSKLEVQSKNVESGGTREQSSEEIKTIQTNEIQELEIEIARLEKEGKGYELEAIPYMKERLTELKEIQKTKVQEGQTGMAIAETTDEKGGLLVAHRGEEVVEKEEISALKKMTDVAKKTIDGKGASLLEGTDFDSMEEFNTAGKSSAGFNILMDNFLTSEMVESKHGGMLKNAAMLFGLAGHGQLGKTKKHGTMVDKFSMGPETIMNLFEKLNYFKERGDYVRGEVKEGRGGKGRARNISELNAVRAIQEISKSMALLGDSPEEKEALDRYEKMTMEERILSDMSLEEARKVDQGLREDRRWDNYAKGVVDKDKKIYENLQPQAQVGTQLNAAAMDRVGFGREKSSIAPTIIDASTVQNVSNNTLIRPPSPSGQYLPGERRDFG